MTHSVKQKNGFTLVELLVTVFIIGIIVVVAIPNMGLILDKNRIKSASDTFYLTMLQARSQAIKQEQTIVVCPSTDGVTCDTSASPAWNDSLIVYEEASAGGFTRQNDEPLLRSVKISDSQITVSPKLVPPATVDPTDKAYAYSPTGEIRGSTGSRVARFEVSDNNTKTTTGIRVSISRTGAVTTEKYTVTP